MILVPPFSLKGRAGAGLDDGVVELGVYGARDARLLLRSMGAGKLSWTQDTVGVVPDIGQLVDLFDGDGVRIFSGRAKRRWVWDSGARSRWLVTVTDAFQEMEETPLTSAVVDEAGGETTRPVSVFPTGDLRDSILALLTRANVLGVGFDVGVVSECFDVPRMTFSKSTLAEALADMLRWIPDAMSWVDYSPVGLPTLNVRRRGDASELVLALGTAGDDTLAVDLQDQPELRPLAVEVFSASRDAQGRIVFGSQVAGDGAAEARRRQTLVASGPENNEVIPGTTFANAWVRTFTDPGAALRILDSRIADYISRWNEDYFQVTQISVTGTTVREAEGNTVSVDGAYATTPFVFQTPYIGAVFGWDGRQQPPEFLVRDLGLIRGEMKGDVYAKHASSGSGADYFKQRSDLNGILGGGVYWFADSFYHVAKRISVPVWLIPADAPALYPATVTTLTAQANPVGGTTGTDLVKLSADSSNDPKAYIGARIEWGAGFGISARILEWDAVTKVARLDRVSAGSEKLSSADYRLPSTPTELVSSADFDFLFPPATLAEDLFAAQDFLPWMGRVLHGRSAPGIAAPGYLISATGGNPAWAAAGALVQSVDIELRTRTSDVMIGMPSLTSATTLLDRFRSASRDNLAT